MARYVVGIDLGTTHTVVAFSEIARPEVKVFPIEQEVSAGTRDARTLLSSALFAPPTFERGENAPTWIVGEHARRRGAEVPSRFVASNKSWLAHEGVDRNAAILPWGTEEEGQARISPVDASATILAHVRDAWDRAHPDAKLIEQEVFLTVPASFDEVARSLTVEATRRAGFPEGRVRLLEEPQAAFLDWARLVGQEGLRALLANETSAEVLVCDVGGGTTDFSLMSVTRDDAAPLGVAVTRIAVGDHLLLGGDNLDLALAHRLEPSLVGQGDKLSPSKFAELVLACRAAKERMLSERELSELPIVVLGSGSKLFAAVKRTTLDRATLDSIVEGFFPQVERADVERGRRPRTALVSLGLPYASDPAITRHLGAFLVRHGSGARTSLLLNGGVFHAPSLVERLVKGIAPVLGHTPRVLPHVDPDLAVARGAVAHGLGLHGFGLRIRSGSARDYYVGVGEGRAVCVIPRGTEAGDLQIVEGRTFALLTGRVARFDLFASAGELAKKVHVGDVVPIDDETFVKLPPLMTAIGHGKQSEVDVRLEGELTEVGTLDLVCVERSEGLERKPRRFKLGFELRADEATGSPPSQLPPSLRGGDKRFDEARARVERAFGKDQAESDPREAKNLVRDLEKILGERATWPVNVVRPLFDVLRRGVQERRRSPDHERVWWSLAGFCLRPGYGDPLDPQRISALIPLWQQTLAFPKEINGWRAWWVAWRRIGGGLEERIQGTIRDAVDPFLAPSEGQMRKKPKNIRPEPFEEMLFLASTLERVPPQRRVELGSWLLERTWTSSDPNLYAAVGRLGARVPAYASAHHVVPPRTAEAWIADVLKADWKALVSLPFAAVQLARFTGDRARDVSDATRAEVIDKLKRHGARPEWIRLVREVVAVDEAQKRELFGEALPSGLRLVE